MTAVVSPSLHVPFFSQDGSCVINDSSSEARKRRREILLTQRNSSPDESSCTSSQAIMKKPKVELSDKASSLSQSEKKPQMKYDPDVPMTREEAAAWRREQRRKRNRESAAASRQRQRDRINELETELEEWKIKYEETMARINALEGKDNTTDQPDLLTIRTTRSATPPPLEAKTVTPRSSPTSTTFLSFTDKIMVKEEDSEIEEELGFEPSKMISRHASSRIIHFNYTRHEHILLTSSAFTTLRSPIPAVKITGSSQLPFLPDSSSYLDPEPCLSSAETLKLDPIDSTLFPSLDQAEGAVLSELQADPEFGEFLLDAVEWL